MTALTLAPEQAEYSFVDGTEVVAIEVAGGAARYRRDILNGNVRVKVNWKASATDYAYLRAFYRTVLNGGISFTIDLILNSSSLTTHTAYFIPGTMTLTSKSGNVYFVSAELEVVP